MPKPELRERAIELLRHLEVADPEKRLSNYPHQLSGGMRQRVVGAMAMASEPELIIADEPTTSLDVTVQAAYLDRLRRIQQESNVAIIFVTHDLGIVAQLCDRVAVMYAGRIVETANVRELLKDPKHPYTEALLNSVPGVRSRPARLQSIEGQPPSIYSLGEGCYFAPRCKYAEERNRREYPPEREIAPGHSVQCWKYVDP
jgi:oligopeptide/dipeptide ABC transporter ATP-binding protein